MLPKSVPKGGSMRRWVFQRNSLLREVFGGPYSLTPVEVLFG
jgi:hypothetical protein